MLSRAGAAIRTQAAVFGRTGAPAEVVGVRTAEMPTDAAALGADGVAVRMLAAPINPSDLNQIEGTYPVKARFTAGQAVGGNEGVGQVLSVGRSVTDLRPGDWVVPQRAGELGTWATHVLARRSQLAVIPAAWRGGLVEPMHVATLRVNLSTAYRLLRDFGAPAEGSWVVQNAANSSVGRAVVQVARAMGLRTLNVVRDLRGQPDRLPRLKAELRALGADLVVAESELLPALRGLGGPAALALNCVGGRAAGLLARAVAPGGWLVTYGGMARQPLALPTGPLVFGDVRACGFWMNRWYEAQGDRRERDAMWQWLLRLAADGGLRLPPMELVAWRDGLDERRALDVVRAAVGWQEGAKRAFVFGGA
ncbi:mitochondrial 2-enoyl thioester reductase [Coemansia interrupta]|uniref:enoyl-[acyl-carrier-protein] reductase n=1 Tax=Coemansia interrupta TaxID=1126814 RepID=A0A9W8LM24_9FUNG|nr:mitochondrial 2-enoyl thioester reductase [Coemansia interrupta]